MKLTSRDLDVLSYFAFHVRAANEFTTTSTFWPNTTSGTRNARRRLHKFVERGLLTRRVLHVKAVREVELLEVVEPNAREIDYRKLASESRRAWAAVPVDRMAIYSGTRRLRCVFGAKTGHAVKNLDQVAHDTGVSVMYAAIRRENRDLAAAWRSEDEGLAMTGYQMSQPDAFLVGTDGVPRVALEFCGDYGADRFFKLLKTCQQHQPALTCQLWIAKT